MFEVSEQTTCMLRLGLEINPSDFCCESTRESAEWRWMEHAIAAYFSFDSQQLFFLFYSNCQNLMARSKLGLPSSRNSTMSIDEKVLARVARSVGLGFLVRHQVMKNLKVSGSILVFQRKYRFPVNHYWSHRCCCFRCLYKQYCSQGRCYNQRCCV